VLIALEVNPAHRAFYSFIDGVDHARGPAALFNWIDSKPHLGVIESASPIYIDDFLPASLQGLFIDRLIDFNFNLFAKSLRSDSLGPIDHNLAHNPAGLYRHDHFNAFTFRLSENTDVFDRTG
jgi:hypothetical protein